MLGHHTGAVLGVAFGPDAQRVVSAGEDGTVQIWDSRGKAESIVLGTHTGAVRDVAFSPDGWRVASAGLDGTVRVWDCKVCGPIEEVLALARGRVTRELTCEERQTFLHEPCRS